MSVYRAVKLHIGRLKTKHAQSRISLKSFLRDDLSGDRDGDLSQQSVSLKRDHASRLLERDRQIIDHLDGLLNWLSLIISGDCSKQDYGVRNTVMTSMLRNGSGANKEVPLLLSSTYQWKEVAFVGATNKQADTLMNAEIRAWKSNQSYGTSLISVDKQKAVDLTFTIIQIRE